MRRVVMESPFAGDVEANTAYARACLRDCLARGEAPIASHLLFPQVLDEASADQRELGIEAGLAWLTAAKAVVFYIDHDMSKGMIAALVEALSKNIPVEFRTIGNE